MNEMQIFTHGEFGRVRVLEEDGKALFCGSDVAKSLGYARPNEAVSKHCKGTLKRRTPTSGGIQEMLFIPEGDVYRLITHSKLPGAQKFESWVFDEVLPGIRRHGAYVTPDTLEQIISNPDFGIRLLSELKQEREARVKAEAAQRALEAKNQGLSLENRILQGEILTWDYKALLNALIRSFASARCGGAFSIAWKLFFKELYYKRSIGVEGRRSAAARKDPSAARKPLYSFIRETEERSAIQTAVAMCLDGGVEVEQVLKEHIRYGQTA